MTTLRFMPFREKPPLISRLDVYLWGNEFFWIHFGEGIKRFSCNVVGDIRVVSNNQRLAAKIHRGMMLATGVVMVIIWMVFIRTCRAVVIADDIEDTDRVRRRIHQFFYGVRCTEQGTCGQVEQ